MEYDKIKQIMEDMGNSRLTEMELEFKDGFKISMKKEANKVIGKINEDATQPVVTSITDGKVITSPMVGTFYLKPSPSEKPFVSVGQTVKKGDVLCIIEAMKLMNEIESEYDGVITEILVNDETPVEYGTKLFKIE